MANREPLHIAARQGCRQHFGIIRWGTAMAMVLALLGAVAQPVAAQVEDGRYTNPVSGLEWAVEWDEDLWDVDDIEGFDLVLTGGPSTVIFVAFEGYDGDAQTCVEIEADDLGNGEGVEDFEPLEDDAGELIADDENGRAFAAFSLTFIDADGAEDERVNYVECRTIVEGESVLIIYHVTSLADYDEEAEFVDEILDTVEAGDGSGLTNDIDVDQTETPGVDPTEVVPSNGVFGDAYESPSYGYTIEWDGDIWSVDTSLTAAADRDVLVLFNADATGLIYFEGTTEFDTDTETCLEVLTIEAIGDPDIGTESESGSVIDGAELLEDPENGEVIEGEEDDRAFVAYSYDFTPADPDLDVEERVVYVECRVLDEDAGLILATSTIGLIDSYFDDVRDDNDDVIDSIEFGATDDDVEIQETVTPEVDATEAVEALETETPEVEETEVVEIEFLVTATPEVDVDETETPEVDETETPEVDVDETETPEVDNGDFDSNLGGVDGNAYESPTYGYSFEWDETIWEVAGDTSEDEVDVVILENGDITLTITGSEEFDGDASTCYEEHADLIADRDGVEDVLPADDDDLPGSIDGGTNVFGVYVYTQDGEETLSWVDCFANEDGSVVVFEGVSPAVDSNENIDAAIEVADTFETNDA